jgi:hypothetical protein
MISGPSHWLRGLATILTLLLAGCGAREVMVQGSFPQPLMSPQPLTLGVWYPEEFREHEFFDEAKGRADSDWLVRTGEAQVELWNTLLGGMFERVVLLEAAPDASEAVPDVDAILVPRVDELQYAIPTHTNIKVYEVWMRYAFEFLEPDGSAIAEWTMTAYGKTPTAFLQTDTAAVNAAAIVALRDAGAHFATLFPTVPGVASWLEARNTNPVLEAGS